MAPTPTRSSGGNATGKLKSRAKDALVGSVAGPSNATALPQRRPFGQEGSDDDGDSDVDLDFPDASFTTAVTAQAEDDDDELMITDGVTLVAEQEAATASPAKGKSSAHADQPMSIDPTNKPNFQPLSKASAQAARDAMDVTRGQLRKVAIPPHRMTPLKNEWPKIYTPLVEMAGLQVRMNVKRKTVEIKSSKHTADISMLGKGADFVKAFALGFEADDAIALLRIDDLYLDSFEIKDVKTLHGDHLSRAIGRIAGKDGRTKFAIENASRTRIVVADTKIHMLGSFTNIRIARDAICSLILGAPPGKVYHNLKTIGARQRQRG